MHSLTLPCSGCPEGPCLEPDYSIEIRRLFISPTTQQSSLVKVSTVIILLIYIIQVAPHSSLSSLYPACFHSPNHSSHLSSKFPVSLAFMRWIHIFLSLPLVSSWNTWLLYANLQAWWVSQEFYTDIKCWAENVGRVLALHVKGSELNPWHCMALEALLDMDPPQ